MDKNSKENKENELEATAKTIVKTIAEGGNVTLPNGRTINLQNCPTSYSEAIESGCNFYMYKEPL